MTPDSLIVLLIILILLVIALAIWVLRLRARLGGGAAERPLPSAIAPPELAMSAALAGATKAGLLNRPAWKPRLAPPNQPLSALLVRRLDVKDPAYAYYYLVPFGTDKMSVGAVAMVDGLTTEFLECSPMTHKGGRSWGQVASEWLTPGAARRAILSGVAGAGSIDGPVGAKPLDVRVDDTWIWTPCVESRSQNYPFRMIVVNGHTKYVRIDGKVFDRVTPLLPGGGIPKD